MLPLHGLQRLEKIMDEYVGGISAYYTTNEPLLIRGLELLCMLKEDLAYLGAEDTENCVAADALLAASTDLVRLLEGIADELRGKQFILLSNALARGSMAGDGSPFTFRTPNLYAG